MVWVVAGNIVFWAVVQVGAGYLAHCTPAARLASDGPVLRARRWEREGRAYERLRIRRWKNRLPEAGAAFAGGVSKRTLATPGRAGLPGYVVETRRAERAHWLAMLGAPFGALWNPPVGAVLMALYGVAFNAPFIVVQRYNRQRAQRVLTRSSGSRRADGTGSPKR